MHGKNKQQLIFYQFTHSFHLHAGKICIFSAFCSNSGATIAVTRIHFQDKLRRWYDQMKGSVKELNMLHNSETHL